MSLFFNSDRESKSSEKNFLPKELNLLIGIELWHIYCTAFCPYIEWINPLNLIIFTVFIVTKVFNLERHMLIYVYICRHIFIFVFVYMYIYVYTVCVYTYV